MTDPASTAVRIIDLLKTPNRAHFVLWVGSGALMFLPETWLEAMRLSEIRGTIGAFVGPLFFLLSVLFVVSLGHAGLKGMKNTRVAKKAKERREVRLRNLSPDEVEVLRFFVFNQSRGQRLSWESAVVRGLEAERVIARVTEAITADRDPFTREITACAGYVIQPWAWEFLNEHPEVLGQDPRQAMR